MKNFYEGAHFTAVFNITKEELLNSNFKRALPSYLWYNFFLSNNRHFKNWWHWGVFKLNGWNFCFLRFLLYLWKRFLLFALIYTMNILGFAISLEKCYSVFSQQNPWELAVKKSVFSKNWTPLQACCKDFNLKFIY